MSTYFTSDHHFSHAGALGLYRRPVASVAEMDREMIDRWNSVVGPDDEVWHLGDFAIRQRPERVASLAKALHGRKHLIVGNKDDAAVNGCDGWESSLPPKRFHTLKTHSAHCCACILSTKAGAGHEVCASVNFKAGPRRKTSSASGMAEPFTPVSNSNRECQLAMLLRPRAFVYSDLREAISIEKRYLTSDLSSRS
jgi:hypothetical protein